MPKGSSRAAAPDTLCTMEMQNKRSAVLIATCWTNAEDNPGPILHCPPQTGCTLRSSEGIHKAMIHIQYKRHSIERRLSGERRLSITTVRQ